MATNANSNITPLFDTIELQNGFHAEIITSDGDGPRCIVAVRGHVRQQCSSLIAARKFAELQGPDPLALAWAEVMAEADTYFEYLTARINNPKYSYSKVKWQETTLLTRIGNVLAVQQTYGMTA